MLSDQDSFHRTHRICDLLWSEIPEEREVGARELTHAVDAGGGMGDILRRALYDAVERALAHEAAPLDLPDTEWQVQRNGAGLIIRAVRRLRGHVVVVRRGGSGFYPVIDGYHPSAYGRPWNYATMEEAFTAAEREVLPSELDNMISDILNTRV